MARGRNKNKEQLILQTSKVLFAAKGFFNTSISDIVSESNLPVGTIYTYFNSKEDIVKAIIEQGWSDLHSRLIEKFNSIDDPKEKIKILFDDFFPELFKDIDLITILLSEAVDYTRLEEKLNEMTDIIFSVLKELEGAKSFLEDFSKKERQAAFIIYFLGIMHSVKISQSGNINLTPANILSFIRKTIQKTFVTTN